MLRTTDLAKGRMSLIELHNVDRWYGTQQALRDVSLHLEPGRIGLLGPNGAGKSTLLKLLLGLLPPSSGSGRILGHELRAERAGWRAPFALLAQSLNGHGAPLRRAIGYMSEADGLIPGLGGAEYVALP